MLQRLIIYSVSIMGFISDCILIYIFRLFAAILCVDFTGSAFSQIWNCHAGTNKGSIVQSV